MTIQIVDIEKLRKINMADEFIDCLMKHVLREKTGWDAPGKKEESRKNNKGVCIPRPLKGERENRGFMGGWKIGQKGDMSPI